MYGDRMRTEVKRLGRGQKKACKSEDPQANNHMRKSSCRGRSRTSTRQLAIMQIPVVNPGRPAEASRLYITFILLSPPPRREGMSAKNFITPQYKAEYRLIVICY